MMDAPWRLLSLLSAEIALLVGIAWVASRLFHRADLRRLAWVACVFGVALVTLGVFTAFPLWLWGLIFRPGPSAVGSRGGAPSWDDPALLSVESDPSIIANRDPPANLTVGERNPGALSIDAGHNRFPTSPSLYEGAAPPLPQTLRTVLILWTVGTSLLLLRLVFLQMATWWVSRQGKDLSATQVFAWLRHQARAHGYARSIRLLASPRFFTPVAFGVFRPTIVLPQGFDVSADEASDRAVILHELKHLINNDPLWRTVADCVTAVVWWHPAAWLLRDQLWKTSEEAADEFSLVMPNGPRELACSLLRYGWKMAGPRIATVAMSGPRKSRSHLATRVRRLLRLQKEQADKSVDPPRKSVRLQRLVIAVTAVAVFFASLGAGAPSVSLFNGGVGMSWSRWCWRHSLLAAAVTAFIAPWAAPAWAEEGRKPDQPAAVHEREEREEGEKAKVEREEGEREREAVREREREGRPEAERREEGARDRGEAREREHREPRAPEGRRDQGPPPPPVLERIERQLAELREQLARAREAGQQEKVRALESQIDRLERARENIRAGRPPEGRPVPPEEARRAALERIERRMQELRERIREAEQAGREGALRELRAEMERLEQALREVREGRMPGPPGPPPMGPVPPERMERARRAAELLRREGFGDMAELLMRAAMGPVPPRPGMAPPAPERPPLPPERPHADRPREERPHDIPRDRPDAERR